MRPSNHTLVAIGIVFAIVVSGSTPVAADTAMSPEIIVSAQDLDEYLPQVAFNSSHGEYLVVWHDSGFQSRSIMGKRLDRWGNTIDEFVIAYNPTRDSAQPSAAYDPMNDRYMVTFLRDTLGAGNDWDLMGRLVPWNGPSGALTEFPIISWGSHQWSPRVGYGSTQAEFFVTWWNEDQTGAVPSYISGARLSVADGSVLGGTIVIASGADQRFSPELAYNRARNEYLIVYTLFTGGQGDVYAVRMNADGSILGGGEFAVAAWPDSEDVPRVAASPTSNKWLVVWQSSTTTLAQEIYARFVNGIGTIDGDPVHLVGTTINEGGPTVSCIGESSRFLVSWRQQYSSAIGPFGVFAGIVNADHTVETDMEVRGVMIGEDDPECGQLASAGGASNSLVVWRHTRHGSGYKDIHGRVVHDPFGDGFESGDWSAWSAVVNP